MNSRLLRYIIGLASCVLALSVGSPLWAQEGSPTKPSDDDQAWFEPIPTPFDPELERQLEEVQSALVAIHKQIVRHKEHAKREGDPAEQARLQERLKALYEERDTLRAVLDDMIGEAKASQRTAIDEALRRARWLERQQESWQKKEELLRDR